VTEGNGASPSSEISQVDRGTVPVRTCVACGYNLFGLGDQPRCPECGLRNIPDEFRRQGWGLVDSGKWFFSGPFSFFRKRPPGWWWALDRPGDLQRSLSVVARNATVAAGIVLIGAVVASSIAAETTEIYQFSNLNDPTARVIYETSAITRDGLMRDGKESLQNPDWKNIWDSSVVLGTTSTSRLVICTPQWSSVPVATGILLWLDLTWVGPVFVGLVTQIRKGLPQFARPPLTIIAAGAYESHRMMYGSAATGLAVILAAVGYALSASSRRGFMPLGSNLPEILCLFGIPVAIILYVAFGWVAPLHSDWTKQLIQSRGHAARIVVMYALLFPVLTSWAMVMLVFFLFFNP